MGKHPLPGYGSVAFGKRLVRTRMLGVVGAGGEIPPATRFWRKAPGQGAGRSQRRGSWRRSRHEHDDHRFRR
jgi:hypothetical protein